MSFADKYETIKTVARGRVEAFVARKVSTDQRVLVYVFEGREQGADEPTVQWALESFRALAPSPPELVVETGRYDGTSYAYLVTKLPDDAALQKWLRSYEVQPDAMGSPAEAPESPPPADPIHTGEQTLPVEAAVSSPSNPPPAANQPEEINAIFEAVHSKLKPELDATPVSTAEAVNAGASGAFVVSTSDFASSSSVERVPGEFTKQFFSGFEPETRAEGDSSSEPSPVEPVGLSTGQLFTYSADGKMLGRRPDSVTEAPKVPDRSDTAELAGLLGSSSAQPEIRPPHTTSPDASAAGDFTDFFQGPFDGGKPSATPELSGSVPKREQTGDFTRLFGSTKEGANLDDGETQVFSRDAPARPDDGTFTKLFDSPESVAESSVVYNPEPQMREGIEAREPRFSGATDWPSRITVSGASNSAADNLFSRESSTSNPAPDTGSFFASRPQPDGATRVFSMPGSNPAPEPPSLPAGPSEYTRIISGGMKAAVSSQSSPAPLAPGSQGGLPMNISVPSVPSPPPVSVPMASPYPQMAPAPSVAPPPVPQLPQPGIAAPTATAPPPWALIIILNVLFILAVALVLYFALRH